MKSTAATFNKAVKVKKEAIIKIDPSLSSSGNHSSAGLRKNDTRTDNPVTPAEKIVSNVSLKDPTALPAHNNQNNEKLLKFFIPQKSGFDNNDLDEQDTPTRSISSKRANNGLTGSKAIDKQPESLYKRADGHIEKKPKNSKTANAQPIDSKIPSHTIGKKSPAQFVPVNDSIVINLKDEASSIEEIFKTIDDQFLKNQYIQMSEKSFDEWIEVGTGLMSQQYRLIEKIISSRAKLNLKFKVIFKHVNGYGSLLEAKDAELQGNLDKFNALGKDIKNFIR